LAYEDTPNKATIRRAWDLPVLRQKATQLGRSLSYLGLPGPEIRDLIDWRDVLGSRTGVESMGRTRQQRDLFSAVAAQINMNVLARDLSSGFQLLRADIEDVILQGVDENGRVPQLISGGSSASAKFLYDVVNLDFDGGIGYVNHQGSSKRASALKKVFERQEGTGFILLLTINVRHTLGGEFEEYIRGMISRAIDAETRQILELCVARPVGQLEYKMKAVVPSFIQSAAELRMFESRCLPLIVYEGHKRAKMVHFVFVLQHKPGNLKHYGTQNDRDLVSLPLIRCSGGTLQLDLSQPGCREPSSYAAQLDFLDNDLQSSILGLALNC